MLSYATKKTSVANVDSVFPLLITKKAESNKNKTILVIMPIGIPGMGKTTFIET